ncbi:MAG: thiamine phosphate synthase [Verrucomicrobiales bacterium]
MIPAIDIPVRETQPDRPSWQSATLYGILDAAYLATESFPAAAQELIAGGVGILQIRAKGAAPAFIESLAHRLHPIAQAHRVPLIINDFPEIAATVGCDGVHVGQEDAAVARARQILGPDAIVGKSTHSLAQAVAAQQEGADYIGFGPLFPTPTKPGRPAIGLASIAEAHRRVTLPIFCIGGIKRSNLREVLRAGARRVVIVSEMLGSQNRGEYARQVREEMLRARDGRD